MTRDMPLAAYSAAEILSGLYGAQVRVTDRDGLVRAVLIGAEVTRTEDQDHVLALHRARRYEAETGLPF
jgi:hypothetical protein